MPGYRLKTKSLQIRSLFPGVLINLGFRNFRLLLNEAITQRNFEALCARRRWAVQLQKRLSTIMYPMNIGTLGFKKNSWRGEHPGFSAVVVKRHPGFRYYDPVFTNAELLSVKMEPSRFLCLLPINRENQVSDIIDSNPHECVGIFVKTEPSRFLCSDRNVPLRFPILWFGSSRM